VITTLQLLIITNNIGSPKAMPITTNNKHVHILMVATKCLTNFLFFFQESVLNGRIEPVGVVEGFKAEIGAGGRFCPKHITLPVTAYFFQLSDDNAPSPYLVSYCPKHITLSVPAYFFQLFDDNVPSPYLGSSCHSLLLPTL
jgi:hypothetical protein